MGRLLAVIVAALLLVWFLSPSRKPEPPPPRAVQQACKDGQCVIRATPPKQVGSAFEREVVQITNRERARRGLQPLKINAKMMADARSWSTNQARRGRMYHSRMGYGENVAWNQKTPQEVMSAWMNSRGHRANILNPKYKEIGVGVVYGNRGPYHTQVFR